MPHRLTIVFALIVAVPLVLIAALGVKVVRDERMVVKQQLIALREERLFEIERAITQTLSSVEQELEQSLAIDDPSPDQLRELARKAPLVVQVFRLAPNGEVLHPPEAGGSSEAERAFLHRTRSIWSGNAMLYEPPKDENNPSLKGATRRASSLISRDRVETQAQRRERGWIAWYWEEGLHLLYFSRRGDGSVLGVEVGRVALMARILGSLPELTVEDGRIVLSDSKGQGLFQWGLFEPKKDQTPVVRLMLGYPLDSFALAYFPGADVFTGSLGLTALSSMITLIAVMLGLAVYFHRERTRELREAEARVGFVTRVSHELKTPLTNIRLYAELLADRLEETDDGSERHLAVIVDESQRLSRMIANILTFSKQQKDRLELQLNEISVDEVIAHVVEQFRPALAAKGFAIEVRANAPRPITADADALGQILGNLLGNVEKYASQGKWVAVESAQDETSTRVWVRDHGPGIPAGQREKIFQPFYRVSSKLSDGVTGTGIGLTIARDLARLHGGELSLASSGEGSVFELRLPKVRSLENAGEKQP